MNTRNTPSPETETAKLMRMQRFIVHLMDKNMHKMTEFTIFIFKYGKEMLEDMQIVSDRVVTWNQRV